MFLEFYKVDDYYPFVCAENCDIKLNSTQISVRTKGDGAWKKYITDTKGYEISCDGVIPIGSTGVTVWDLWDSFDQQTDVAFRMIFRDRESSIVKAILGNVLVASMNITGPMDFAGQSISFTGNGAPSFQDNLLTCQATIGSVVVSLQTELAVHFTFSGVVDSTRIDYSIDGGGRKTVLFSGGSGLINLNPVQTPEIFVNGSHTVLFYPICESGDEGAAFTLTFTKT